MEIRYVQIFVKRLCFIITEKYELIYLKEESDPCVVGAPLNPVP